MGFFKRTTEPPARRTTTVPPMGSGRKLRSSQPVSECLNTIEALVDSYRPSKYAHLPAYDVTGFIWHGDGPAPDVVVSFGDANDDFVLATFWQNGGGGQFGLFPLGSGDDRLSTMSVIANWKTRDSSLSSIGIIPGGQITLAPPPIAADFVAETLELGGIPDTARNRDVVGRQVAEMVMIKATQFIGAQDPRYAERFASEHDYSGGPLEPHLQTIVRDLAAWEPGVLPYIQGVATRARAIMLGSLASDPGALPLER